MNRVDDFKKYLRLIVSKDDLLIYEYTPSLFRLVLVPMEPLNKVRKFRFLLEYIRGGYKIYYLAKDGIVVGYCVITPGGRRLKCSTTKDAVIGPYFITQEYRGQGLSKILISQLVEYSIGKYEALYDWVYKNNLPSIHCMEACGFEVIGKLNVVGVFRRLIINTQGLYFVYRKACC